MNREQAKQEIKRNWEILIQKMTDKARDKVNGKDSYVCPLCGHGRNGDGMALNPQSKDGFGLKCFACGFGGDIIDLCQQAYSMEYNRALEVLAEQIGITVDAYTVEKRKDEIIQSPHQAPPGATRNDFNENTTQHKGQLKKALSGANTDVMQEDAPDYTEYYQQCRARLYDPACVSYLQARGISQSTAEAYWLGFDPQSDPAKTGYSTARVIIPTTPNHYVARAVNPIEPKYKAMNPKGSTPGIFNTRAIYADDVQELFVCEGAFDALSVLEVGGTAIALNSASNKRLLLDMLKEYPIKATLILCLDNDTQGAKATEELKQGLKRLNISFVTADICGRYKDPNEHLQHDREAFWEAVQRAIQTNAPKPDNTSFYIDNFMIDEMKNFRSNIKTGFPLLDQKGGGLYAGLYVIAAISSLGKTTFVHQIADQIAEAGHDVLYFSLEQSRLEMVTKSLSRILKQERLEKDVNSLKIRKGYWSDSIQRAIEIYKKRTADRMSIIEGNFGCNISFIGEYVRNYISKNNVRPVVIIDYLQILMPEEEQNGRRQSTKETVDLTVTELKRMTREYNIPVIAISSVNRANYTTSIEFESLKESGSVEFTADVIWGLQLSCIDNDPAFSKDRNTQERRQKIRQAKDSDPREIDLKCLKNRYGKAHFTCYFTYYPSSDVFEERQAPINLRANKKIEESELTEKKPIGKVVASGIIPVQNSIF